MTTTHLILICIAVIIVVLLLICFRTQRKKIVPPINYPQKTPEQIAAENQAWIERFMAVHFEVDRKNLLYDPDEHEVLFYTPIPAIELENEISSHLTEIKEAFAARGYRFVYLPDFNSDCNIQSETSKLAYFNPRISEPYSGKFDSLTHDDLRQALNIPDRVDSPCFIRCKDINREPVLFSYYKIVLSNQTGILDVVSDYISHLGRGVMYHLASDDEVQDMLAGKPADERFDTDVYLIGKEIRDRIDKLRSKGLSSLAIRKLIGDDSDKPSHLLIDRHYKLYLTDYGNKEIKLSPIHKAVFFLFLRHPEGIYFKDLPDYKDELESIYNAVTGRLDPEGIGDSIDRLTNPLDNSINEKCARIKNAFVSEFREEVAQWYFIDGRRGERKLIKLPRDLVTWQN